MSRKNKILIIITIVIVSAITIVSMIYQIQNSNKEIAENNVSENIITNNETQKTIEEIKTETGAMASEDIYEIKKEYDGREVLAIKPDIQFKTVLAGILKNDKPSEQDIEKLDISKFHNGIWISEVSRDKFLQILEKCGIENFKIDSDGYLYKSGDSDNPYSSRLESKINLEKLTVIDITGTCYIRDEMTGNIIENPFKDMDLYQVCEKFETTGGQIIIITTNDVNETNILEEIC